MLMVMLENDVSPSSLLESHGVLKPALTCPLTFPLQAQAPILPSSTLTRPILDAGTHLLSTVLAWLSTTFSKRVMEMGLETRSPDSWSHSS